MTGDHAAARRHYEEALAAAGEAAAGAVPAAEIGGQESDAEGVGGGVAALRGACLGGIARCMLHAGDVAAGKAAALQVRV